MPRTALPVLLPLTGDPVALLHAASHLVERWPDEVEAELVVAAPPLDRRARTLLAALDGDVRVLSGPHPGAGFGQLVSQAAAHLDQPNLLVLDPARLPQVDDLRALVAGQQRSDGLLLPRHLALEEPVLSAALDLRGLQALVRAVTGRVAVQELSWPVREARFDPGQPGVPGLVSVVIPVWNQLEHTRACVESVRRATRRPYEIVVVDNGSTDGTHAWLSAQRDLVVVTNEDNRGFAAACNQGIAASRGELVVLLNNDTLVPRFWIEGLRRALDADDRVGAVGPRSNSVSGPQVVREATYRGAAGFRAFADAWRRQHAGSSEQVRRLVGFCLALRRSALLEVGGLDEGYGTGNFEDDDLCLRLRRAGWTLRVAHEVLVHHAGSATFRAAGSYSAAFARGYAHHRSKWGPSLGEEGEVLLSAALIVKDEQRALPSCLAALTGRVDEIVVCDTGSSDRTVEVAEAFGARVVHTSWDSDFAAARNVALDACRGAWVLSVDADEQLVVDPAVDLRLLVLATEVDALSIRIRSRAAHDDRVGLEHDAGRLFRRGSLRWVGAVHESLRDVQTGETPIYLVTGGVLLEHDGYLADVFQERDKAGRNLALAEKDFAQADPKRRWKVAYELARALSIQDEGDPRLEPLLTEALAQMPAIRHLRCDALVRLAVHFVRTARLEQAEQAVREALALQPDDAAARLLLSKVLAVGGRPEEALRALEGPGLASAAIQDTAKQEIDVPQQRAALLHRLGRSAEASDILFELAEAHLAALDWTLVHRVLAATSEGLARFARLAARDPENALAGLDGLPRHERDQLHEALRAAGVEVEQHTPEAVRARQLAEVLAGRDPATVRAAALELEGSDVLSALDLWSRLPEDEGVRVARARCLVQLGRVSEAVSAVEGMHVERLTPEELLVIITVAALAGDRALAQILVDDCSQLPPQAAELVSTLGLLLPDRVKLDPVH